MTNRIVSKTKSKLIAYTMLLLGLSALANAQSNAAKESERPSGGTSIPINNGIVGDGAWEVEVEAGGNTSSATLDPVGAIAGSDVVFAFDTYIDVGTNGTAISLTDSAANPSSVSAGPNNSVTSTGQFPGNSGAVIQWSASGQITPGTQTYQTTVSFTSAQPFGAVRVINYLDEDVLGSGDDRLILINSPLSLLFRLLTIDDTDSVGIAHTAAFQGATNAIYIGWAASDFSNLRSDITSAPGAQFSIAGVVNPLDFPLAVDPRFPFSTAYGPADATAAFAFDLNPSATTATVVFGLVGDGNLQNDLVLRNGFEN